MKVNPVYNPAPMTVTALLRCAAIILGSFSADALAGQAPYSHGDPSALEQQMLEAVNRSRSNPTQEGVILDSVNTWYSNAARAQFPSFFRSLRAEFTTYPASAPLAFNPLLIQVSRAHSQDMVSNRFFSHVNRAGQDPTMRAAAVGYAGGVGENLDGAGAATGDEVNQAHFDLMVDYNNIDYSSPLGHRLNVLNGAFSEVGIGIVGPFRGGMITQNFGAPTRSYILGVAYTDTNHNGAYDAGEGLSGITVRPDFGNWYAITSTSGGFAIPVDPVESISDSVNVPFPVQGNSWNAIQPYDAAYRQQQMANAPAMNVNLVWSGARLASPISTSLSIKRPVVRNYRITGTDGWYYTMSMVTSQNAKADLKSPAVAKVAARKDFNGDAKADIIFQNGSGQIYTWLLDGSGNAVNPTTGAGRVGAKSIFNGWLGDWKVVARADVNGDSIEDIVFQNNAGQIYAWFLDGSGAPIDGTGNSGRVGSRLLYADGLGDWRIVACADVNRDGKNDFIFQNNAGQIFVWFLNGTGNAIDLATSAGRVGARMLFADGLGDWRVVACTDLNSDGANDLAFQNNAGQIYVWFLDGTGGTINPVTGAGRTAARMLFAGALGDWRLVTTADFNGDSLPDLAFQNGAGQICVWFLNGTGTIVDAATGAGRTGSVLLYGAALSDWRIR